MLDAFIFYPNRCFVAVPYWETPAGQKYRLKATYDQGATFKHNDGWIHSGPDEYSGGSRCLVPLLFWVGYFDDGAQPYYRITALPDAAEQGPQRFQGHRLDTSVNGFLGLYPPPSIIEDSPRWQMKGLDWKAFERGESVQRGIKLYGEKRLVRGNDENGQPHLNEQHGTGRGSLTLEFLTWRESEPGTA